MLTGISIIFAIGIFRTQKEVATLSENTSIKPLITAEEIFPEMERQILSASKSVYLSLHVFSPRTSTRSHQAHQKRLLTWGDLIADALRRGVKFRLLINDFDPAGAADLHAQAWERLAFLNDALETLTELEVRRLRVLIALPGGQTGYLIRSFIWPKVWTLQRAMAAQFMQQGRQLPPGLSEESCVSHKLWPPRRNFTQALHQKFLVCDNQSAIVGGLDIDERRFDDPAHRRNGEQTWHDVSVRAGPVEARQLAEHFLRSWRYVARYGTSFDNEYIKLNPKCRIPFVHAQRKMLLRKVARIASTQNDIVATIGAPHIGALNFGPSRHERSLELAHYDLIGHASHFIYIETQYLRSTAIRDALVARMGQVPHLRVIVLLPSAPDVVAYESETSAVQRYGEWLQMRALERLAQMFPGRFGAFCLTNDRDRIEVGERDALYGKAMVYIHSKVIIADDRHAIVSSANLNGRSLEWDYEAGLYSHDAGFASSLRQRLWHSHLGEIETQCAPNTNPGASFDLWQKSAVEREKKAAHTARIGIVPYPIERTRRFSKYHMLIPQQMV